MVRLGWVTCTVWATTCPVSDTWLVLRTDTRDRSPESRILHQMSDVIRCYKMSSDVIRCHQMS